MEPRAAAERYFGAWNAHDAAALAGAFAPGGSYSDPGVPGPLDPAGAAGYAATLWRAFPDLAFEVHDMATGDDGTLWARWRMTGTNDGAFGDLPPTGLPIDVAGADLLRTNNDGVVEVQGFFDTGVVPRQLGLDVIVQPKVMGPVSFGVATAIRASRAEPGAMSLTVLEVDSEAAAQEVRDRSRETVTALMATPGFISFMGVQIGSRMYTITAWESVEAVDGLRANPGHRRAMARFYEGEGGLATGGQTGVWGPERLNGMWVRCACGAMSQAVDGRCDAGHELPAAPAYW